MRESEGIAVIGMSGIFPGSLTLETFWKNLLQGEDLIREIPRNRWNWKAISDGVSDLSIQVNWGGFIEDIDVFDARFFNISPKEAEFIDPQQRLLLQVVWQAVENAGYAIKNLGSQVGVFVGASTYDYSELLRNSGEITAQYCTSTFHSVLANRISYLFDFQGPSEAIDTACSSSLVAIHRAVQALRNHDCEWAIVGGVNALLTPTIYLSTIKAGMLSEDGRCKTFDKSANGFVRSEGIGAVLLKPVSKALKDNDFIYGVIKGTATNHGGHVSSLTVPNARAQADVIAKAIKQAQIEVETITYIETHGTGTALGDPIEVNGLKEAFFNLQEKQGSQSKLKLAHYCGLGSVKTNIGHLEAAAGITSLIKTLLAMYHKKLPGILHFKALNPYIDLKGSPFYIIEQTRDWGRLKNEQGEEIPRRAGVSSFGFGGVNAHVILEEGPKYSLSFEQHKPYYLLTLSAKHPDSLKQRIEDLNLYLQQNSSLPIEAIAYTLNVRRSHFNHRLAMVVSSSKELQQKLEQLHNNQKVKGLFRGQVAQEPEDSAIYKQVLKSSLERLKDLDVQETTEYSDLLEALANLYAKGYELDWRLIHQGESQQAIALPTYPFLKERYWLSEALHKNDLIICDLGKEQRVASQSMLHPLVGSNTSTLEEQSFKTVLTGEEFFLRDHIVGGQKVLPGVAYLEMARAAGELALPGREVKAIEDIVWLQPVIVQESEEIHIHLEPQGEKVAYTVYSMAEAEMVCSQGLLSYEGSELDAWESIESLSGRLPNTISKEVFYQKCQCLGLSYGPSFQAIEWIKHSDKEVLGYYRGVRKAEFLLAPNLLDAALQVGLVLAGDELLLPFALESIKISKALPTEGYIYFKADALQVLNIEGKVCLELQGFSTRPAQGLKRPEYSNYYLPRWHLEPLEKSYSVEKQSVWCIDLANSKLTVVLQKEYPQLDFNGITLSDGQRALDNPCFWEDYLKTEKAPDGILFIGSETIHPETQALFFFRLLKALPKATTLWLKVVTTDSYSSVLIGLALAAVKECSNWKLCCLITSLVQLESLAGAIMSEPPVSEGRVVCLNGMRAILTLSPYQPINKETAFRQSGVYVIIGGAGGIGSVLSEYLAEKYQARLAWIGRRAQEEIKSELEVFYYQADVSDYDQVQIAIDAIKNHYGVIHGVFDSAFVLNDSLLEKMSEQTLMTVLLPKVSGSMNLYQAVAKEPLDFLVFFSSVQSFMGLAGQSNYAAASTFQDTYALSLKASFPVKVLNWGYWGTVGSVATEYYRERMRAQGVESIQPEEGMQAVELILQQSLSQLVYGKGIAASEESYIAAEGRLPLIPLDLSLPILEPRDFKDTNRLAIKKLFELYYEAIEWPKTFTEIKDALKIIPTYERLLAEHLQLLCSEGWLIKKQQHYHLGQTFTPEPLLENNPYGRLLLKCLPQTLMVMQGKKQATEVLFPEGSLELIAPIYQMPEFNAINHKLAELVLQFAGKRDDIRILEIGAGTGSTSRFVLEALKHRLKVRYYFTDISQKFIQVAEEAFAKDYPFIEFTTLDIEKFPLQLEQMDIVIASNVLHATADIHNTLEHCKVLLKQGGLLLLNEVTEKTPLLTLTFGLTPGWWVFKDAYRIPGSPLLSSSQWQALLNLQTWQNIQIAGFNPFAISIILAQSDGVIRQEKVEQNPISITRTISQQPLGDLKQIAQDYLLEVFSKTLKIPVYKFSLRTTFEQYGVDSLLSIDIIKNLTKDLGNLPATLLFEYNTLEKLGDYLLTTDTNFLQQKEPHVSTPRVIEPKHKKTLLSRTNKKNTELEKPVDDNQIAIIGMNGRYPGASNLELFWNNLKVGKDCITEIPEERWVHNFDCSKWGGFISDIDKFDPLFFSISPREAERMDPQERLFLETAWGALEDSGYTPELLKDEKVGVFVGVMNNDYSTWVSKAENSFGNQSPAAYWSIANRVSYCFDFMGPSLAVDTACSSSLTALHLACESLKKGESGLALAGGVNLIVHPSHYLNLNEMNMLSKDAACKTFGATADGFVVGEGVGVVLLKPLSKAILDRDNIYGVILSSHINAGGKTSGYTVPNPNAHAVLINEALKSANIHANSISYLEAHGTGTSLGDPIEIRGLTKAFDDVPAQSCPIGSVKSNLGHLESAAGIVALTKVLLQLKHKQLVPSLHSETLNPYIEFQKTPFYVQKELTSWQPKAGYLRRAGISSFGAGGSNAHVIIEEGPEYILPTEQHKPYYLITLSAKHPDSLKRRIEDLSLYLKQNAFLPIEAVSYTLNVRRNHFNHRVAVVVSSIGELEEKLGQLHINQKDRSWFRGEVNKELEDRAIYERVLKSTLEEIKTPNYQDTIEYKNQLEALANLYVKGYELDWGLLHQGEGQQAVALPTYPFLRDRYWALGAEDRKRLAVVSASKVNQAISEPLLHPLLGANTSTVDEQSFKAYLIHEVVSTLKQMVGEILKIAPEKLEEDWNFSEYGMDSIKFGALTVKLNDCYQLNLTPTVFYAQPTIQALSTYLATEFGEYLSTRYKVQSVQEPSNPVLKVIKPKAEIEARIENKEYFPVAIIGMSGLFPQSDTLDAFWQHLSEGEDLITEIPPKRWDWREYYSNSQVPGKSNSRWGGFITGVDYFDAAFFNISPREAELMDPQHRLFLETVWKMFEEGNYNPYALPTRDVGVFVGVQFNEYQEYLFNRLEAYAATGNAHTMLPNRVSYLFDLQGPSETIDTACSSSLIAIHRAVSALHNHECRMAIAGGVSLALSPRTYVMTSQMGMLSSDGRCKTFDKAANGYVKGEGVGAILLKPLAQAKADGDKIHGIIIGSAVNHGGKAQSLTAPNPNAQSELLKTAYRVANVHPSTISYIEVHGTGTVLGDPIEINGLKKVFNEVGNKKTCGIGCVKTNIGHLEPAAGIAGVIKVLLSMQHGKLPGNVHFKELNPYIELENTPFYIIDKMQDWQRLVDGEGNILARRAGISSFGFGGANAHLVLEEGPEYKLLTDQHKPYYLICLSAKHPDSLKQRIEDLSGYLAKNLQLPIEAVSYTLNSTRTHFSYRSAVIVRSTEELKQKLELMRDVQEELGWFKGEVTDTLNEPSLREHLLEIQVAKLKFSDTVQYKELLEKLAAQYVIGYNVNWALLHQGESHQKISLPTYPFLKTRYWINDSSNQKTEKSQRPWAVLEDSSISHDISIPLDSNGDLPLKAFALRYLQQVFSEILKIPVAQLLPDKTYEIFGVDSLSGMALIKRLEADFGALSQTLIFEKNCLTSLSEYFLQEYPAKLGSLFSQFANKDDVKENALEKYSSCFSEKARTTTHGSRGVNHSVDDAIAIIGLNAKYPLSETALEFWNNLKTARDCITDLPINRWDPKDYPVTTKQGIRYYNQGGFISDVDKFDPLFFNISPFEASLMDPQERLFLQIAWKTIEDAGYTRERLKEKVNNEVGVFVGVTYHFYPLYIAEAWSKGDRLPLDIQLFPIANRVSYFFNFSGPSFPVDTACSSSLAAIHMACESIKQGGCKMALAGGVNLSLHPAKYHLLGTAGMLSENGRCMSFAATNGTGYVPGEGVGAVLLKPLKQAIQDRDLIYGIIRSTSMNHGGKTSGFTVPNPTAQSELIVNALLKADIDARTVNYVEAHGTGTSLGDPIEVRGLQLAFQKYTQDKQFCAIGSVKSNIGHLESAAGISQLTKVLLQFHNEMLVPSLHSETLNPHINFSETAFYVERELEEWQSINGLPRRAGISSFGAGGVNVHIIVEEYVPPPSRLSTQTDCRAPFIFILSAYDKKTLYEYIKTFYTFLTAQSTFLQGKLENICYTLQIGREAMSSRFGVVVKKYEELLEKLDNYLKDPEPFSKEGWLNYNAQQKSLKVPVLTSASDINYELLTKQWVEGGRVAWSTLHASHIPQIVPMLPTYPFARRRCWIPNQTACLDRSVDDDSYFQRHQMTRGVADQEEVSQEKQFLVQPSQVLKEWLYTQTWRPIKETESDKIEGTQEKGCWLILGDKISASMLTEKIGNEHCIQCLSGETFSQVSSGVFSVNPLELQDYEKMFLYITEKMHVKITEVVCLWPCDQVYFEKPRKLDFVEMSKIEEKSETLLIFLKMLVRNSAFSHSLRFSIVTRSGQAVTGKEQVSIWQHHLWALTGIFSAEYPQYSVKHIDLDAQLDLNGQLDWLYHILLRRTKEAYFAYRNNQGYVLRLAKNTEQPDASQKAILKIPRMALITGGLGALGLEVANWLIERGTKSLLLIGNTILPDRSEWNNVIEKGLKSKIDALIALERRGSGIHYAAVDVSDQEKMQKVILSFEEERHEVIESIFHLAGITTDSVTIEQMSRDLLKKVLGPKVQGTLVLNEIFKSRNLKHFVLFSSVSAIPYFGLNGLTAYATANAFLEGFAHYRRSLKLPVLCVSWTAWQDKGMSFEYKHTTLLDAIGLQALPVSEGVQILEYLLSMNYANSVVQKIVDWNKFFNVQPNLRQIPYFEDFNQQQNVIDNLVSNLSLDVVNEIVTKMFSEFVQLPPNEIDYKKSLQDYGMDSIFGINFVIKLGEKFPNIVSVMDLYRYNNIEKLAAYIFQKQKPPKIKNDFVGHVNTSDYQDLLEEILQLNEEEVCQLLEKEIGEAL